MLACLYILIRQFGRIRFIVQLSFLFMSLLPVFYKKILFHKAITRGRNPLVIADRLTLLTDSHTNTSVRGKENEKKHVEY